MHLFWNHRVLKSEPPHGGNLYFEVSPASHHKWRVLLGAPLRLVTGMVCCFIAARWGALCTTSRETSRETSIKSSPETALIPQGRGELWLRCPSEGTWYNYTGDSRTWQVTPARSPGNPP